jgi:YesN/AraC family two-component response regulator
MPHLNGLQLTAMIRTINTTVPIILCSGHVERFEITPENAIHYGINKVIHKPVKMKVLIDAVHELIDKRERSAKE